MIGAEQVGAMLSALGTLVLIAYAGLWIRRRLSPEPTDGDGWGGGGWDGWAGSWASGWWGGNSGSRFHTSVLHAGGFDPLSPAGFGGSSVGPDWTDHLRFHSPPSGGAHMPLSAVDLDAPPRAYADGRCAAADAAALAPSRHDMRGRMRAFWAD